MLQGDSRSPEITVSHFILSLGLPLRLRDLSAHIDRTSPARTHGDRMTVQPSWVARSVTLFWIVYNMPRPYAIELCYSPNIHDRTITRGNQSDDYHFIGSTLDNAGRRKRIDCREHQYTSRNECSSHYYLEVHHRIRQANLELLAKEELFPLRQSTNGPFPVSKA